MRQTTERVSFLHGPLVARFLERIWRCKHRHPCQRCCWPWGTPDQYDDPQECWRRRHTKATFYDKERDRSIGAHLMAYIIAHDGMLVFPGKEFAVCHQCDYGHCCNDSHLSLGARADNGRDRRGKDWEYRAQQYNIFPDGRKIYYLSPREMGPRSLPLLINPETTAAGPLGPRLSASARSLPRLAHGQAQPGGPSRPPRDSGSVGRPWA
jgi:hypothetical protein